MDDEININELKEFLKELAEDSNDATKEFLESLTNTIEKKFKYDNSFFKDIADDAETSFDDLAKQVNTLDQDMEHYRQVQQQVTAVMRDYHNLINQSISATASFVSSVSGGSESMSTFSSFIQPMGTAIELAISSVGLLTKGILGSVAEFGVFEDGLNKLGKLSAETAKLLGKAASEAFKFAANIALSSIDKMWGMFTTATEAGLLYAGGMRKMVGQLQDLNLTMDQYATFVKSNTDLLAKFGGTISGGMDKMHAVMQLYGNQADLMREYGISYEEQAERTAEFLLLMERAGQARALSDRQISNMSLEYMKNLKVISALTGKSADQMKKERDEAMQNLAWQAKIREMARVDPEAANRLNVALSNIPEGLQQAFKESVLFGKVMTDVGAITSGVAPDIENFARAVVNGNDTVENEYMSFVSGLRDKSSEIMQNLDQLLVVGLAEMLGKGSGVTKSINDFAFSLTDVLSASRNLAEAKRLEADLVTQGKTTGSEGVSQTVAKMRDITVEAAKLTLTNIRTITSLTDAMAESIRSSMRVLNPATRDAEMARIKENVGGMMDDTGMNSLASTFSNLESAILPLIGTAGAFSLLKSSIDGTTSKLPKLAAATGAFYIGTKIGDALYDSIRDTNAGVIVSNTIGRMIDYIMAGFGSTEAQARLDKFEKSVVQPSYTTPAPREVTADQVLKMLEEKEKAREEKGLPRQDTDITPETARQMTRAELTHEISQPTTDANERKILIDTLAELVTVINKNNEINNMSNKSLAQIQQALQ